MKGISIFQKTLALFACAYFLSTPAKTQELNESMVYSVRTPLSLGNPGEKIEKDYYLNIGAQQGVRAGDRVNVLRRASSYDLLNKRLYTDVTFPIAQLKIIHVEGKASIARLEKILPQSETPTFDPPGVMVGDLVRKTN